MTRDELKRLINKGKITVTGLLDKSGEVVEKYNGADTDLDTVARQYVTEPGIVDKTDEGLSASKWLKEHDSENETTEPGGEPDEPGTGGNEPTGPDDKIMPQVTITGLEEMLPYSPTASEININIVPNDYKGANVTLYVTAENARLKKGNANVPADGKVWSVKQFNNPKDQALKVIPEDNMETYSITVRLVDDQNTELSAQTIEFTVYPKPLDTASLKAAMAIGHGYNDGPVVLEGDIDLTEQIIVDNTVVLDLNGKTLNNTNDIWGDDNGSWSLISVQGGNLTINGNGTLHAKENDCYAVDVRNGGSLTVNGGTYEGNVHALYVLDGHANVAGGTWSVQQKFSTGAHPHDQEDEFVLNMKDEAGLNGSASISVSGGSFVKFNPADNQAEPANTDENGIHHSNILAPGYKSERHGDVYTVVPE